LSRYASICAKEFGAEVKNWLVLNEPAGFTSLGYMLAKHAPGKASFNNYLAAIHHAVLAQAAGGRVLRDEVKGAHIGTTFSCSEIIPLSERQDDREAAKRLDIILNRLFIEPALGRGYPQENFRFLEKLHLYNRAWKYTDQMQFNFDFIGLQNYFPLVVKYNSVMPIVQASEVKASARKVPRTLMGWEINPESFYRVIKRFWMYGSVKEIIITESGAAFKDKFERGAVHDKERIEYHEKYLSALLKAKREQVNVTGYFVWTLMDNFEWTEGIRSPFGLVHVDFQTQLRTIKRSGYWFRDLLQER
jgi:beta-glucosidase